MGRDFDSRRPVVYAAGIRSRAVSWDRSRAEYRAVSRGIPQGRTLGTCPWSNPTSSPTRFLEFPYAVAYVRSSVEVSDKTIHEGPLLRPHELPTDEFVCGGARSWRITTPCSMQRGPIRTLNRPGVQSGVQPRGSFPRVSQPDSETACHSARISNPVFLEVLRTTAVTPVPDVLCLSRLAGQREDAPHQLDGDPGRLGDPGGGSRGVGVESIDDLLASTS